MTFSQSYSPKLVTCLTIKQLNAHLSVHTFVDHLKHITRSRTSCSLIVLHTHPPCHRFLRFLGNACQPKLILRCITYRGCKSTGKRHGVQSGDRSEQLVQRCSLHLFVRFNASSKILTEGHVTALKYLYHWSYGITLFN